MKYLNQMEKYINKTYCFDIDGVICSTNCKYEDAIPNKNIIELINKLYDNGNYIIINTSRGYKSKTDWSILTTTQINEWGVKYHQLLFTKPAADFYIDDKNVLLDQVYEL